MTKTKHEKYIQDNPEYEMHLVDEKFGDGKTLVRFFYRNQINNHKQGFLAYVDSEQYDDSPHTVIELVQNYLIENEGVIDLDDFIGIYNEDNGTDLTIDDVYGAGEIQNEYQKWYKDEFPKIDLCYGGVCHFDIIE